MKNKLLLLMALLGMTTSVLHAQQDYQKVLKETFDAFDSTQDMQAKLNGSNKLVLIAKKYTGDWAPQYYAAYSKLVLSFMEQDATKKDAYIDDADSYIAQAATLYGKESSEIDVLKAWAATARISVKPQERWMKYGKTFTENLEAAKKLNPDNPRIYYLKGTNVFFTPKAFGGGKKAAKEYFEKAKPLFEKETPDDITNPYWGKGANAYFLGQCEKED